MPYQLYKVLQAEGVLGAIFRGGSASLQPELLWRAEAERHATRQPSSSLPPPPSQGSAEEQWVCPQFSWTPHPAPDPGSGADLWQPSSALPAPLPRVGPSARRLATARNETCTLERCSSVPVKHQRPPRRQGTGLPRSGSETDARSWHPPQTKASAPGPGPSCLVRQSFVNYFP